MIKHLKYKVAQTKECKENKHSFIVSSWSKSAVRDIATSFTCSVCCLVLDKTEVETLRDHHDCTAKEKYAFECDKDKKDEL